MTQITPLANQTSFPVSVGLFGDPLRIALLCPDTGLLFDMVFNAHYDWTSTSALTMVFDIDNALTPDGYTGLAARAAGKPYSTVQPTFVNGSTTVTLSRSFPTSTTSSVASFNVWVTGEAPDGATGIVAWHDPTWPVGQTGSGGPGKYAAEQTNYYYMNSAGKIIEIYAQADSSTGATWLQTGNGAQVGQTMVVSPPIGASTGNRLELMVKVSNTSTGTVSTTINTTVGNGVTQTLSYTIGGQTKILTINLLDEAFTSPPIVS